MQQLADTPKTRRRWRSTVAAVIVLALAPIAVAAQDASPPYWVSINRKEAVMRRGPASQLPAMWTYVRRGLPMRVIAVRGEWRQVQDPAGITGWMHVRLLTSRRTAIVIGGIQPMRTEADGSAPVAYRAEPGVVGYISDCGPAWCRFDVHVHKDAPHGSGWIATNAIWGDGPA